MSDVNRKITYRLYPNQQQGERLQELLGLHCRTYNTLLEEHKRRYDEKLPTYTFSQMCRDLTRWRSMVASLEQVNAQSLQVTAKRVSLSFAAFFRRIKSGETPGYPRFKSCNRYPGWGYKHHGDGWRFFETPQTEGGKKTRKHHLRLSGVGDLKVRGTGRFTGMPKTCEIIQKAGAWYASITFVLPATDVARLAGTGTAAFDWGISHLLTIAKQNGSIETVDNPRFLKQSLASLKNLQQAVSREQSKAKTSIGLAPEQPLPKGTKLPVNRKLARLYRQLAVLHRKIANQRHDFYHKLSTLLVSRFGTLVTEELNIGKMTRKPEPIPDGNGGFAPNGASHKARLHQAILDAAPGKLLGMIATKAEEAATTFTQAVTYHLKPTQRCHSCGTLVPKDLTERWHTCPECNCHLDRDANAAKVMLRWLHEGDFWLGTSQVMLLIASPETPSIAA